jgi:tricorn protease
VEKLTRKPVAWEYARDEIPEPYPPQAPRGPVASVCDEHAGSDGDIVNEAFKAHGIPVVGVRTWGGVVGIDERYSLVDGTVTTQPRYGFGFYSVGMGLENHGCDPTVEVPCPPQDFVAGRDPQLDTAIAIALESLAKEPAAVPPNVPGLWEGAAR